MRSFQSLFDDGGINHNLVPKRCMMSFQMSDQFILALERFLTSEAHMRQQLRNVGVAQEIHAGIRLHSLHHQAVRINLGITELISSLNRRVEIAKVLFQAMLGQEDLVTGCAWEGCGSAMIGCWCLLSMRCHVHGILSNHRAIVFTLKVCTTKLTRVAGAHLMYQECIPISMLSENIIVCITPVAQDTP
jgi:hypothetical protein